MVRAGAVRAGAGEGPLTDTATSSAPARRKLAGPEGIDAALARTEPRRPVAPQRRRGRPTRCSATTSSATATARRRSPAPVHHGAGGRCGCRWGWSFMGAPGAKPRLIGCLRFEQATKARKPPQFLPTLADRRPPLAALFAAIGAGLAVRASGPCRRWPSRRCRRNRWRRSRCRKRAAMPAIHQRIDAGGTDRMQRCIACPLQATPER